MGGFLRRNWQVIGFVLAAAAYYPRFIREGGMLLYRHAAGCLWTEQVMQACDVGFTYPPAFAFLMLPFAAAPLWLAVFAWYLVTLACMTICLVLCKKIAFQQFPGDWTAKKLQAFELLSFFLSLKFLLAVYEDQSFDLLALLFLLFGILALMDRRDAMSGAMLAIATAIKVTPLIFLPYLIFKRRFMAAGVFTIVLAAFSFLPDLFFSPQGSSAGYFITWVREIAAPGLLEKADATRYAFWDTANPLNLSLRGMVALAVDQTSFQPDFLAILRIVQATFVVSVGALFLLALRWKLIAVEGAMLIIAMLMLAPMSGRSHFVQLALPYSLLVAAWLNDEKTKLVGSITLLASFILCTGIPRGIAPKAFNDFMTMHSDVTWGALVVLPYLAVIVLAPYRWGIPSAQRALPAKMTEAPA